MEKQPETKFRFHAGPSRKNCVIYVVQKLLLQNISDLRALSNRKTD